MQQKNIIFKECILRIKYPELCLRIRLHCGTEGTDWKTGENKINVYLEEPIGGLIEFIQKEPDSSFNNSLYELYSRYLPVNALREIIEIINSVKE